METYEEKKKKYLERDGYTEDEIFDIFKLEGYAEKLSLMFDKKKEEYDIDFNSFFSYLDEVQDKNCNDKIKSYSEYLRGAALPFYESVTQDDMEKTDEFDLVLQSMDWVTLLKKLGDINYDEFNKKIKINGALITYFEKSKYKWALGYGVWHHFQIKNYREEKLQSFEKINK